jgi:hypothetical protein
MSPPYCTPWFSPLDPPVRVGAYEVQWWNQKHRRHEPIELMVWDRKWDMPVFRNPKDRWRGLLRE